MQTSLSFRTALSCILVCYVCPGCCFCLSCFVSPVVVRATLRSIYPSLTMSNILPMMNDSADLMNVFCGFFLPTSGLKKGHGNAKWFIKIRTKRHSLQTRHFWCRHPIEALPLAFPNQTIAKMFIYPASSPVGVKIFVKFKTSWQWICQVIYNQIEVRFP